MYDFVIVLLPMVTTVNETIPVLTVLFTFNATDADGDPLTFPLIVLTAVMTAGSHTRQTSDCMQDDPESQPRG